MADDEMRDEILGFLKFFFKLLFPVATVCGVAIIVLALFMQWVFNHLGMYLKLC